MCSRGSCTSKFCRYVVCTCRELHGARVMLPAILQHKRAVSTAHHAKALLLLAELSSQHIVNTAAASQTLVAHSSCCIAGGRCGEVGGLCTLDTCFRAVGHQCLHPG